MSNVQMPSIKYHRSKQEMYPLFIKTMRLSQFEMVIRCMCVYNENDYLSNRNVLQYIRSVYYPKRTLSIDEGSTAVMVWTVNI